MRTAHDLDEMVERYEQRLAPWREEVPRTPFSRPKPEETDRRREMVRAALEADPTLTREALAAQLGANPGTITRDVAVLGLSLGVGTHKSPKALARKEKRRAEIAAMAAEYAEGASVAELSEKYGLVDSAVRNRLKEAGVWKSPASRSVDTRTTAGAAMHQMATMADLLVGLDHSPLAAMSDEDKRAWEGACKRVGSALAAVRRQLKGTPE